MVSSFPKQSPRSKRLHSVKLPMHYGSDDNKVSNIDDICLPRRTAGEGM